MQLSQKPNTLSGFFAALFEFRLNFKYLETKYDPHNFCISGINDFEYAVR